MNQNLLILSFFLLLLIVMLIRIIFRLYKARIKELNGMNTIKSCSANERRRTFRSSLPFKAFVATNLTKDKVDSMAFKIRDISSGGLYFYTELDRPAPFTIGEEIELVVNNSKLNYVRGKALVVHSEAVFNNASIRTESGFGVKFLKQKKESRRMNGCS